METSAGVARKTPTRASARTASEVQGCGANVADRRSVWHVFAMLNEHRIETGVVRQDANQFGPAVAAKSR